MAKQKERTHREGKEKNMNEHQEQTRAGVKAEIPQFALGEEQPTGRQLELSTKQQGS